jgi:hypothetical protein
MVEQDLTSQAIPSLLSVVIVTVGDTVTPYCDTSDLRESLRALTQQDNPPKMEIIVPYHSGMMGIEELRASFPSVKFLYVEQLKRRKSTTGGREHHDEMRAIGMAATHGEIIAFLEDHVRPDPSWSMNILKAHSQPYAAIGGAIENGVNCPLNWAVYYCDLGKYQNPVPNGESLYASTVNISYKRTSLEAIKPVWRDVFNETLVNTELLKRGEKIALSPLIIVFQHRLNLRLKVVLKEFFIWGRSYARIRAKLITKTKKLVFTFLSPLLPGILLWRMGRRVIRRGRNSGSFLRAFPLVVILVASWSAGEFVGYLSPAMRLTDPLMQPL